MLISNNIQTKVSSACRAKSCSNSPKIIGYKSIIVWGTGNLYCILFQSIVSKGVYTIVVSTLQSAAMMHVWVKLNHIDISISVTHFQIYDQHVCNFTICNQYDMEQVFTLKLTWKVIYHWKRQPYFFLANFFLKQGISSEYVMVDFICMDRLGLQGAKTENYKMKNSCP